MGSYNITLNENASPEELKKAKKQAQEQGGKITNEFELIPGFTVEFPDDAMHTLASNKHITVEKDAEVRTQ